ANSMVELFDYAMAFAYLPLIAGNRLAIVTNAGGPGIIATDAAERNGLALAQFTPETITLLQRDLPPAASVFNPIDVIGDARSDRYRIALAAPLPAPHVEPPLILF